MVDNTNTMMGGNQRASRIAVSLLAPRSTMIIKTARNGPNLGAETSISGNARLEASHVGQICEEHCWFMHWQL